MTLSPPYVTDQVCGAHEGARLDWRDVAS